MKTYINREPVSGPWGGGNMFVKAFHKEAPNMGVEMVTADQLNVAPDVILLAGLDNDGRGISAEQAIQYKLFMQGRKDIKLILRVNENDARKGTSGVDDMLLQISQYLDGTVFVSNWLRDYFLAKGWADQNHTVIVNGVDQEIFKPQPKLENGKLNIAAHHWSDNRMKGADIYERIDEFVGKAPDKFAFTYIGRHKCNFKHTTVVRPLFGKKLGEELGKHDIYVSASVADPGPNHISESISCGLPTYVHTDGGGCVEFAGDDHVYRDWEELESILLDSKFVPNSTSFGTWRECIERYTQFIASV